MILAKLEKSIGRLVLAECNLDEAVMGLLGHYSGTDEGTTVAIYRQVSIREKIDMLRTLWRLRAEANETTEDFSYMDFSSMLKNAQSLCDFRNSIVHGHWVINDDDPEPYLKLYKRKQLTGDPSGLMTPDDLPMPVSKIDEKSREIDRITSWFVALRALLEEPELNLKEDLF